MRPVNRKSQRRWFIWLPLLMGAAYLAYQDTSTPPPVELVNPTARTNPADAPGNRAPDNEAPAILELIPRDVLLASRTKPATAPPSNRNLFEFRSWTPVPPPPPPAPPVVPTAPALPFTFLGKKVQDGQWEVFLAHGDITHVVKDGATFARLYQVQRIQPPTMTIVYLPLNQAQTLSIGPAL